jgi:hypothetical protein
MSFDIKGLHREKRWSAAGLTPTIGKGEALRRLGFFSNLPPKMYGRSADGLGYD